MLVNALLHPEIAAVICEFLYGEEEIIITSLNSASIVELQTRRNEVLYLLHALLLLEAEAEYHRAIERDIADHIRSQSIPDFPEDSD